MLIRYPVFYCGIAFCANSLTQLYNLLFRTCIFATSWKVAKIVPIFKIHQFFWKLQACVSAILLVQAKVPRDFSPNHLNQVYIIKSWCKLKTELRLINMASLRVDRLTQILLVSLNTWLDTILENPGQIDCIYTDFLKIGFLNHLVNSGFNIFRLYFSKRQQYVRARNCSLHTFLLYFCYLCL